MPNPVIIGLGRLVQRVAELRGGGSALPGLVVEKLDPRFAVDVLGALPLGVVLVSGTNGKTTTVKVVSEVLEACGLAVFTNNTGSNFMRGVISSLLRRVSLRGRLDADIAVLELDEAHAVTFVDAIKPQYSLLLNVMQDQLDRFGDIDYTASLLQAVACNTIKIVVLNREDSRLAAIPEDESLLAEVRWFGLSPELVSEMVEDELLLSHDEEADELGEGRPLMPGTFVLSGYSDGIAQFSLDSADYEVQLALKGSYNAFNAAAALALLHAIVPETPVEELLGALAGVQSAFGRGESVEVDGRPLELVLVKNPSGFSLALKSFDPSQSATMIALNDDYGDGRDMSWLYDVDFTSLKEAGAAMLSGVRAYDMALRLAYDEVPVAAIECDLDRALEAFLDGNPHTPLRIYCCYTAMLSLRKALGARTEMETVR